MHEGNNWLEVLTSGQHVVTEGSSGLGLAKNIKIKMVMQVNFGSLYLVLYNNPPSLGNCSLLRQAGMRIILMPEHLQMKKHLIKSLRLMAMAQI